MPTTATSALYCARQKHEIRKDGNPQNGPDECPRACRSERASPIVFTPNKNGSLRFCINFRKLSAVPLKDAHPILRTDEFLELLGKGRLFPTLDANSVYWKIDIGHLDKDRTAITLQHGIYGLLRMPFGLKNALGALQRAMDDLLVTVKWQFMHVNFNDVFIF